MHIQRDGRLAILGRRQFWQGMHQEIHFLGLDMEPAGDRCRAGDDFRPRRETTVSDGQQERPGAGLHSHMGPGAADAYGSRIADLGMAEGQHARHEQILRPGQFVAVLNQELLGVGGHDLAGLAPQLNSRDCEPGSFGGCGSGRGIQRRQHSYDRSRIQALGPAAAQDVGSHSGQGIGKALCELDGCQVRVLVVKMKAIQAYTPKIVDEHLAHVFRLHEQ